MQPFECLSEFVAAPQFRWEAFDVDGGSHRRTNELHSWRPRPTQTFTSSCEEIEAERFRVLREAAASHGSCEQLVEEVWHLSRRAAEVHAAFDAGSGILSVALCKEHNDDGECESARRALDELSHLFLCYQR